MRSELKTKLNEVEQERDLLKTEVEQQKERLRHYDGDRAMLRELPTEARSRGSRLRENNPTWEAADEWASTVSGLIRDAFGETPVEVFMDDKDDRLAAARNATRSSVGLLATNTRSTRLTAELRGSPELR